MSQKAWGTTLGIIRPAARIAAFAAALAVLLAPALWNGYPLLQYDTGGYLARWYEGYLVPSRSTVFGLFLHAGEGLHFWPVVIAQSALTLWLVSLTLRLHGIAQGWRTVLTVVTALSIATTLPWLTSILLTDIFAGLSVLALHLLVFRNSALHLTEKIGLVLVIAFAAASHSATLAMLLAVLCIGAIMLLVRGGVTSVRAVCAGGAAITLGAAMLLTANFALSGKWMWTPGGYGIVFGRMLQDGIVKRYLDGHCPGAKLQLCPYRNELPATADEFLWNDGVFNRLGRFTGLGEEMRTIALGSLVEYPYDQIRTAIAATAQQLVMVATGAGVHDKLWHTYGIVERFIRGEIPAMRAARQQRGELGFELLNRLHVPVALMSMALMLLTLFRFRYGWRDELALLAASVCFATLANAFVCGALSGPHERYGARMSWVTTFLVIVVALRGIGAAQPSSVRRQRAVTATP